MGGRRLADVIRQSEITFKDIHSTIEDLVKNCKLCQLTNAQNGPRYPGSWQGGTHPGTYWEIDFTEIKPGKYGYKYFLVFVDTFSGWKDRNCKSSS